VFDVADAAVRDAPFDDNRALTEGEPEVVKGIKVKGERRFHLSAAATDFPDHGRLEDHDLTVELAEDLNTLGVAFVVAITSHGGLDYITR